MQPKVSVGMIVHNGEKYIEQAISSILEQDFTDFELLIIDDGSTDKTSEIIKTFQDKRIKIFQNTVNKGIVFSRNRYISESKGKYIAVMDSDDISKPNRLSTQYLFLEKHPEIALCGSSAETIDENGNSNNLKIKNAWESEQIAVEMLFGNQFVHSSTMFRADIAKKFNGYQNSLCEDYLFFAHICEKYKAANEEKPLLFYRQHSGGFSKQKRQAIRKSELDVLKYLYTKFQIEDELLQIPHYFFTYDAFGISSTKIKVFFEKIIKENNLNNYYETNLFNEIIFGKWLQLVIAKKDRKAAKDFVENRIFSWRKLNFREKRKLVKIMLKF